MNGEHANLEARFAAPADRDLPPGRHHQHREVLMNYMLTESGQAEPSSARRPRRPRRRILAIGGTAGAVIAAAAAAAVTLAGPSAPAPSRPAGAGGKAPAKPAAAAANPILAQLAADITARQVKLAGNATLEIRNQSPTSDKPGANGIDLYTDNDIYYWGLNRSDLRQAIASHQDEGQGQFKRDIAAALVAVKGDIATARARMAIANLVPGANAGGKRAEIEKLKQLAKARHVKYVPPKPLTPEQKKEQTDNFIWMNSLDALTAAPGNARVRAGVLAIMATMPNVKVTHTVTAGQPTLTLADSWPQLADGSLVESLVINASTGFPVALFNTDPGQPLNATYYHTSRVTVADVAAGRF